MFCPSYRSSLLKALVLVLVVVTSSQPMHLSPELRGATQYLSVPPRAIVSPMPRSVSLGASNPPRDLLPSPKLSAVAAPFDFTVSVSPGSGTVAQTASVSAIVSATLVSGVSTSVTFSAANLPLGVMAAFTPVSCNVTCFSSVTFSAISSATMGSSIVTIKGDGGGLMRTADFQISVVQFYPMEILLPPLLSVYLLLFLQALQASRLHSLLVVVIRIVLQLLHSPQVQQPQLEPTVSQ